ncbi:GntR family transcriptional regulator [Bradyrhizobium sp.]|jgi:DNA-binding GntR family transcriptional regulator|uniref:GntR family transcriptional regulator n=1 Tax=Bradyrhizobium sp. TaxID=376 RepID=UPI002CAA4551|nr:GntR family transcriptional regulator [Bradyrhizobium sp.]HWX63032.1 GntR family transcriptional regulator [Bradyrhizobium sp.]
MDVRQSGAPSLVSGPSLREQARQVIRGLIITGQMQADQLYSVPRLATDLGVSATPVREALLDLAREGLLEPVRNRGFRVVSLSSNELNDIFAIRVLLEVPSIADIARAGLSAPQKEQLHNLAAATKRAADAGNLIEFLEADRKFHVGLIATLGNKPLADLVDTLRDRVRLNGFKSGSSSGYIVQSANEHFQLLDCLAQRDETGAVAVMRRHLERSRSVWVEGRDAPP